jgi:soluble lytic murein transglycosylase-like protein
MTGGDVSTFRHVIEAAAVRHGLDPRVLCGQVYVESSGNPYAIRFERQYRYFWDLRTGTAFRRLDESELRTRSAPADFYGLDGHHEQEWVLQSCSIGLGQVMGAVARELGFAGTFLTELLVPDVALEFQCRKLASDLKWSGGNYRSALAAYNGGRSGNQPGGALRNETYVQKVENAMRFF